MFCEGAVIRQLRISCGTNSLGLKPVEIKARQYLGLTISNSDCQVLVGRTMIPQNIHILTPGLVNMLCHMANGRKVAYEIKVPN